MRRLWLALTLAVTVIPSAPSAVVAQDDEFLIERVKGTGEPQVCDRWHMVSCDEVHFDGIAETPAGTIVRFDGKPYLLLWQGNGYYLDSGAVIFPDGPRQADLAGQQWLENDPSRGRLMVSLGWRDVDSDGLLGPGDTLVLAGSLESKVKDVRLNFRVKRLASGH